MVAKRSLVYAASSLQGIETISESNKGISSDVGVSTGEASKTIFERISEVSELNIARFLRNSP
jgi:hypothetical protein